MALKSIKENAGNSFKKATEIPVGGKLTGYVVSFEQSRVYEDQTNIVMQGEDGTRFTLATAGTLRYDVNDNRIASGIYTEIVNKGEEKRTNANGKSYKINVFDVLQDSERPLAGATLNQAAAAAATTTGGGVSKLARSIS